MRNEFEDLQQQAREYAKQQAKNYVKAAAKKVGQQMLAAIAPVLPVIGICTVVFIVIVGFIDWGTIAASAVDMQSASTDSWNQFLKYMSIKEGGPKTADGKDYIVYIDGSGNPTVGQGLCIKSTIDGYLNVNAFSAYGIDSKDLADRCLGGETDLTVSVEICTAIFGEAVKSRYDSVVAEYPDLTTYQHYALTDVKYRRGNTSGFQTQYDTKWSSSDDKYGQYVEGEETFSAGTLFDFFWNGGHDLEGVNIRKKDQWVLFKYGYYRPLGEYFETTTSTGTADTSSLNSNDYAGTYLSTINGYTFIKYYQNGSSWSGDVLNGASGTNIGMSGCNVTSNAIVLSALTGDTITPRQINNNFNYISNDASRILYTSAFSKYSSQIGITGYVSRSMSTLISNLKQGKVAVLKFATPENGGGNVNGWAATTHFVACVDYKNEGGVDYVYIINPTRGASRATGWYSTSSIDVTGLVFMRFYYKK